MNSINTEISDLRNRALNEIDSLSLHRELKPLTYFLTRELNDHKYDPNDELSMKSYKAFLQTFLDLRIKPINDRIVENSNESIFDYRSEDTVEEISSIEKEISDTLDYITENLEALGRDVLSEYRKLKEKYKDEFDYTLDSTRRRMGVELCSSNEPILSIYGDTGALARMYANNLKSFKEIHIDPIKVFIENDKKIKEIFKKAYESLDDPTALDSVKKLEANYLGAIDRCNKSGISPESNIFKIQESMIESGMQLDSLVDRSNTERHLLEMINSMTLNTDLKTVKEIEKIVEETHAYEDIFYENLYAIIEKEKYINYLKNKKPLIYESLSDTSKNRLERMFIDKLKTYPTEEASKLIVEFKKNGYIGTLDEEYRPFFERVKFKNNTTYELIKDDEYVSKYDLDNEGWNGYSVSQVHKRGYAKWVMFFDNPKFKPISFGWKYNTTHQYGDIVKVSLSNNKSYSDHSKPEYFKYVDIKTGKIIKPFETDKEEINRYYYKRFYVTGEKPNERLYDKNDWSLKIDGGVIIPDYEKKGFISIVGDSNKGYIEIYDSEANPVKKIPLSNISDKIPFNLTPRFSYAKVNDGVFAVPFNNVDGDWYIRYYDLDNDRLIDEYKTYHCDNMERYYGYSDGLYVFHDYNKDKYGYKDRYGNVVIDSTFNLAEPFVNGIAYAFPNSDDFGFINKDGDFTSVSELPFIKSGWSHRASQRDGKYYYWNEGSHISGHLESIYNYIIDNNKPIREINFKREDKPKIRRMMPIQ